MSSRKYQKAIRYSQWLLNTINGEKETNGSQEILKEDLDRMKFGLSLNLAAVKLKLSDFTDVIYLCNEVSIDI